MASFSVIVLTAPPAGVASDAGGAFVKVDGRESLLRAIELFLNRETIAQVMLVVSADAMENAKAKFGNHLGFSGIKLVTGGPRWIDQIVAAKATLPADATHVVVHDGARPAVPSTDIDALLEAAAKYPAAALVLPIRTPLLELDEGGSPVARHSGSSFMQLLTPQAFDRKTFDEMVLKKAEPHASKLRPVIGSPLNVRVGSVGDAGLVKAMIGMLPKKKIASSSPFDEAQW